MASQQSGYSSTDSRWKWNLEMWVFVEGGKPEYPERNPLSKDENQQQTPHMTPRPEIEPRATLVVGECTHYCSPNDSKSI